VRALVDPTAFDRIVSNLIANAVRYGAPPVRVTAGQRDTHFRLAVEDRGPGVGHDFVPRLFERFARAEASTATKGSGLGLAIAQSFANAHGGELMYAEAEPRGARFELVLPHPPLDAD
jgi:signal transduction histidine kinase